jgi:hypothetical protein
MCDKTVTMSGQEKETTRAKEIVERRERKVLDCTILFT